MEKNKDWRFGYIVARNDESSLYLADKGDAILFDKPYVTFASRVLSASANYDNPGTLTIHTSTGDTYNFSYEPRKVEPIGKTHVFDEVIWTN